MGIFSDIFGEESEEELKVGDWVEILPYGEEGEIIDIATEDGLLEKSGSWYSYNGEKLGQGRESVKAVLKENTKLRDELENKIREKHDLKPRK